MHIVEVTHAKGALCAEILATLPTWFGIAKSNAGYVRAVESLPTFAAMKDGRAIGFLALERRTPFASEIHVMGVRPEYHRHSAGRALVEAAAVRAREDGARFLTVKTLSARAPDAGYARTRAFYEAMGFCAIEEFAELWDPKNPALLMLKVVG
jgi:ribosomal protein S18 acetylase RimI-like enzyme